MNSFSQATAIANRSFDRILRDDLLINGQPARGIVRQNPEAVLGFGTQLLNGAVLEMDETMHAPLAVNAVVTHDGTDYVIVEPDRAKDAMGWRKYLVSRR